MCRSHVLSTLTSDKFEVHLMHDQNQQLCRDLQNFKPVESVDVHQNFCLQSFWHLVFRVFKSSDAGDVHQNFCLQNLQHLIRTIFFRGWDCSSELPVSESSEWLLGKSSELSDADYLLIRTTSSEAL